MSEQTNILGLITDIVKMIVDNPDAIKIEEKVGDRTTVIHISVEKSDIGKVIGKGGRLISAIRAIAENIAAKNEKRVSVHVMD